jgi:hypothetical protein
LAIALGYHGESLVEEQGKRTSRGLKVVAWFENERNWMNGCWWLSKVRNAYLKFKCLSEVQNACLKFKMLVSGSKWFLEFQSARQKKPKLSKSLYPPYNHPIN